MPYSIYKKLQVEEVKPIIISLPLAHRFLKYPLTVLGDVPFQVGKLFITCDFIVMEMEEDSRISIIIGRPFLAIARAMNDVKNGTLSLQAGDEMVEFLIAQILASLTLDDTCCRIDVLEKELNQEVSI